MNNSVVLPNVEIGRDCWVENAVIDKGCVIPEGMEIGKDPAEDAKRFYVTDKGITLVTPDMLGMRHRYVR